jgi:hypothetical protein
MKRSLAIFCVLAVLGLPPVLMFCVSCTKHQYEYFGGIHGTVTDLITGEAISNAHLLLSPGGANGLTDINGYYQFVNLEPGQFSINIQHVSFRNDKKTVTVRVGESVAVNFSLIRE